MTEIQINFGKTNIYTEIHSGEHRTAQLIIPIPNDMRADINFYTCVISRDLINSTTAGITEGESGDMYLCEGKVYIMLTQAMTSCKAMQVQLCGYKTVDGEAVLISKSPVSEYIIFSGSLDGGTQIDESTDAFTQLMAAKHNHANMPALDKINESDGQMTFNGLPIESNGYTDSEIDEKLAEKSDTNHTHSGYAATDHTHDDRYYTESEVDTLLVVKSNISDVYNKTEVDGFIATNFNMMTVAISDIYTICDNIPETYYNKDEVNTFLAGKSNADHTHDGRYYTEAEVDTLLEGKASVSDPLEELAATPVYVYTLIENPDAVYPEIGAVGEIYQYFQLVDGEYTLVTGLSAGDSVYNYYEREATDLTLSPASNHKYYITVSDESPFLEMPLSVNLPTPSDLTVDNSILAYYLSDGRAINWGENVMYANGEIPTIESGKYYDLIFTYNPIAEKWCVGAVNQAASS